MIHRSKKDWWLVALVGAAVMLPLAFGLLNVLTSGGNPQAGLLMIFTSTAAAAILLGFAYPVYYIVAESELIVRSGFLQSRIPIAAIVEVRPTKNPLSSPAWSLDRLRVEYRKGRRLAYILISPEDKVAFMRELASHGRGLEFRGERLVSVHSKQ